MVNLGTLAAGAAGGAGVSIIISAIDNFSGTFAKMNTGMLVAGAAVTALGVIGAKAISGMTKTAIEFESAFAGVKKTVELSEQEFETLRNEFKQLSKVIPVTFIELSSIGEIAGQLGVEGVANLKKFTKTIADISVTTNLTSEEAATSFARIANIMQEPIENVDKMGSAVVDLGNNFATTEAEISTFATRIAGAGKISGLTTADILGIGAAFSSVGVQAEAGGTAVQKVLIKMNTAVVGNKKVMIDNNTAIEDGTKQLEKLENQLMLAELRQSEFTDSVKESTKISSQLKIDEITEKIKNQTNAIEELEEANGKLSEDGGEKLRIFAETAGLSSEEFQKAWREDAGQAFALFVTGLGTQGDQAINTLKALGLEDQRLVRSFLSLSNAGELINETMDLSSKAWEENTALVEEANKRYETAASQLQIFKNKQAALGDQMGKVFLPILIKVIDKLGNFLEFLEEHPTLTKFGVAALAIGTALALIVGPMLIIVAMLPLLSAGFATLSASILPMVAPILVIVAALAAIAWAINNIIKAVKKIKSNASNSNRGSGSFIDENGIIQLNKTSSNTNLIRENLSAKVIKLNDFIISNGKIIKPHKNDTIIGTKTPENLGNGGRGVTIIIEQLIANDAESVATLLQRELQNSINT